MKKKLQRNSKETPKNFQKFNLIIEDFIPESNRGPRNPALRKAIEEHTSKLGLGQSFFLPTTTMGVGTVRKIVNQLMEANKSQFKNKEIRVVASKKEEIKGCRVVRYNV